MNTYPSLRKTTESSSYLQVDISISICNNKYVTEVYLIYVCCNIPAKPTYSVYVSQLVEYVILLLFFFDKS